MKNKGYLEVEYYLIVQDSKIELCDIFYDLEFDNLQDAIDIINSEIRNGIETTGYSNESTIKQALLDLGIVEEFKKGYEAVIRNIDEIIQELSNSEEVESEA